MAPAKRGLLDTSVFIALDSPRPPDTGELPNLSLISPITVAELQAGVLAATDLDIRARRLKTLDAITDIEILVIDADVAAAWARLRVHLAQEDRRVNVNDLWIAATAVAHGLPVVTQDEDFDPLDGIAGLSVIRV